MEFENQMAINAKPGFCERQRQLMPMKWPYLTACPYLNEELTMVAVSYRRF
jgi:hypothetical protein